MKKLFNNTPMRLMLALSLLLTAGCQEYGIDSQPSKAANIQVDALETYQMLAESPTAIVFNISANTPWRIDSDSPWCKVTPSMSAVSSLVEEISVTAEDNPTYQPRTAVLTISAESLDETHVVTITQEAKTDFLVVTPSSPVKTEGGPVAITVRSNKAWEYLALTDILQDVDKKSGEGTGEDEVITINVPVNSGQTREGEFMIRTATDEYTYVITQDGLVLRLTDSDTAAFNWDEQEKTVGIDANIAWKVTVPEEYADWISAEKTNNNLVTLCMKGYNDQLVTKSGYVTVSPEGTISGVEDVVINVEQECCYTWTEGAEHETVDGGEKIMFNTNLTHFVSKFNVKQGRVRVEFSEVSLHGTRIMFDFTTAFSGNATNWRTLLNSVKTNNGAAPTMTKSQCGGDFSWVQHSFSAAAGEQSFDEDTINEMEFAEFELVLHESDRGTDYNIEIQTSKRTYVELHPNRTN